MASEQSKGKVEPEKPKKKPRRKAERRQQGTSGRRLDPDRPLDYAIFYLSLIDKLLAVTPKQCQDFIAMSKYILLHPRDGVFIPGADKWGKGTCSRVLQTRGKISADCPLFRRETRAQNGAEIGGIYVTLFPADDLAKVLEKRAINSENALARWSTDGHATACADAHTEEEEEGEEDFSSKKSSSSPSSKKVPSGGTAGNPLEEEEGGRDDAPPPPSAPPPPPEGERVCPEETAVFFREMRDVLEGKKPPTPTHAPAPQPDAAEEEPEDIMWDEELEAIAWDKVDSLLEKLKQRAMCPQRHEGEDPITVETWREQERKFDFDTADACFWYVDCISEGQMLSEEDGLYLYDWVLSNTEACVKKTYAEALDGASDAERDALRARYSELYGEELPETPEEIFRQVDELLKEDDPAEAPQLAPMVQG